ncbi:GWT1-domain-containing protein [Mycena floridula]|nr:GWT1-domain-containing protein [Mycena floridula]
MSDYKASKESFVSGHSGSTVTHINLISTVALVTVVLHAVSHSRFAFWRTISLPGSWTVLVLPLLLSMTVFAAHPGLFCLILLIPTMLLLLKPPVEYGSPLPSQSPLVTRFPQLPKPVKPQSLSFIAPLPALTTYRAHMILMTVLAILAVDFPAFPRSLAKCETFGVSLMDIGVGSFVFSQGVVSAIPFLKNPKHLVSPLTPKLYSTIRKVFPVLLLGFVRVAVVKATGYPEHESEYGRHWNFFFTLAVIPVMQIFLHPLLVYLPISGLAVSIAIAQQLALSKLGLEDFALNAPRVDLTTQNKEGLVSLPGYLAIHLLGLSLGTMVLPPTPSYFRRIQRQLQSGSKSSGEDKTKLVPLSSPRKTDKAVTELAAYAFLWWFGMYAVRYQYEVSRRLANLSYILWIAAYNTTTIIGYMLVDLNFFSMPKKSVTLQPNEDQDSIPMGTPPPLLEAINKNSLAIFLLANVLTGLVNMLVSTIDSSDIWAMIVLATYSYTVCTVAWTFRHRRLLSL